MSGDLFGHEAPAKQFRDIRNQRPSAAQEKAQLLLRLGASSSTRCRSVCRTAQ